jgi:2,3-bisphosphoglycerate-dependent phosphoglycerate mutase
MGILVLVRHGQSLWNAENRFTGRVDVELTNQGIKESRVVGHKLINIRFDAAFTSELKRAWQSLQIILEEIRQQGVSICKNYTLNERSYGKLEGLKKDEVEKLYGKEMVALWRRSYIVAPPGGESLKATKVRVLGYYKAHIEPLLAGGKNILVVGHGNTLRALLMYIENISESRIAEVELKTGALKCFLVDKAGNYSSLPEDQPRLYGR